jgi:DNA-binding phage protein
MDNDSHPEREPLTARLLVDYLDALDRGDLDRIEAIFLAAMDDPDLDRLIAEANRDIHDAAGLAPLANDAGLVRRLLRKTIPSAFLVENEPPPVTVGEVAAKLRLDTRLDRTDRALVRRLAADDRSVPPSLTRAALDQLHAAIGEGSAEFWRRFRDAALMAWLGRGHQRTQLAATRVAKVRELGTAAPDRRARRTDSNAATVDPAAAARAVYAAAGRDLERAGAGIAPLDDVIAAYPIRHADVPGLTYRAAAAFLAKETGQIIDVGDRPSGELAGFLFCLIEGDTLIGCILVRADDPIERRRFSAAHELGHYIQHFLPLVDRARTGADGEGGARLLWEGLTYANDNGEPSGAIEEATALAASGKASVFVGGEREEAEANRFAAEVLMPAAACRASAERHAARFGGVTPVRVLAGEFLVSQEAMKRRLGALGLLGAVAGREKGR